MPTILLARPEAQTAADMRVCAAAGWRAVPFSPIRIEADTAGLQTLSARFAVADAVFWVSPSAVRVAAPTLVFSDGPPLHITVGQGSAQTLAAYCPHEIYSPTAGNDSEAVLQLPVWQSLPQGAKVLIIRGHGGREFLIQALQQQGFQTDVAEVYFRRPEVLDWALFAREQPQAVYVTSSEIVRELFAQVPPELVQNLKTLLYFTHHERIAAALRAAGAKNIRLTARLDMQTLQRETE